MSRSNVFQADNRSSYSRRSLPNVRLILADEFLSELDEETSDRVIDAALSYVKSK